MIDPPYTTRPYTVAAFGAAWCGPPQFDHGKRYLVARYYAPAGSDGQSVEVFCSMVPADFFTIQVLEGVDAVGKPTPAYELSTGSSMAKLAADIGQAIADFGWESFLASHSQRHRIAILVLVEGGTMREAGKRCGLKDSAALVLKRQIAEDLIEFFGQDVIRRLLDGIKPDWESDLRQARERHLCQVASVAEGNRITAC